MILSGGCLLKFKALMSVFSSALQSARVCLGICRFVFFIEFCLRSLFCLVRSDSVDVFSATERWMAKIQILYVGLSLFTAQKIA